LHNNGAGWKTSPTAYYINPGLLAVSAPFLASMSSEDRNSASPEVSRPKGYDEEGVRLRKRVNALHRVVVYTRIIIRVVQLGAAYFPSLTPLLILGLSRFL